MEQVILKRVGQKNNFPGSLAVIAKLILKADFFWGGGEIFVKITICITCNPGSILQKNFTFITSSIFFFALTGF